MPTSRRTVDTAFFERADVDIGPYAAVINRIP